MTYRFSAQLLMHAHENPWYFVTLPEDISDDIEAKAVHERRGFGSVRVNVTVGSTTWSTSVFPDTKAGAYVLPVKRQVRSVERLEDGSSAMFSLTLADPDG